MSELPGGEWGIPPSEPDDMLEVAKQVVFYGDLDRASETFNMLAALDLIRHHMETGEPLDHERLERLHEGFGHDYDFPDTDTYLDEDGYEVTTDKAGNVISRVESSPSTMRYFREEKERRQTTAAYVTETSPRYVNQVQAQLAGPEATEGVVTRLVKKGRRDGEIVSQNELEQAALGEARDELRRQGLTVIEEHTKVGEDGSPEHPKPELTHTLHRLTATRPNVE